MSLIACMCGAVRHTYVVMSNGANILFDLPILKYFHAGGDDPIDLGSHGWLPYTEILTWTLFLNLCLLWRGLICGTTHHSGACY